MKPMEKAPLPHRCADSKDDGIAPKVKAVHNSKGISDEVLA
jgi:hypothetical protein